MGLTEEHIATLRAAIDRIVPADEWPSASQAGVLEFLVRLVATEGFEEFYASGLEDLNSLCMARCGVPFTAAGDREQDGLLRSADALFIESLATQTIEGYYANPENGGNREGIAWKMIGYEVTA